jgi:hypothetical protein
MSKLKLRMPLAALAAVALLLAMASCNDFDDPDDADSVPVVEAMSFTGTVASDATTDVAAVLTVRIHGRAPSVTGFYNEVTFTDYTVDYFGFMGLPVLAGVVSTTFIPVGSTGSLTLTVLPGSMKGGFSAGDTLIGRLNVNGHDLLGNPVSFNADIAIIFT